MRSDDALVELYWFIDEHRDQNTPDGLVQQWLALQIEDGKITPEIVAAISKRPLTRGGGEHFTPDPLADFMARLSGLRPARTVLDPTCGSGLLLRKVAEQTQAETVHGVDINAQSAGLAQALLGDRARIIHGDVLRSQNQLLDQYDFIVAEPPMGVRFKGIGSIPGLAGNGAYDFGHALCVWACTRLSSDGTAVILVTPSFFFSSHGRAVQEAIHENQCRIRAAVHLPGGTLRNTSLESYLLLIERGDQGKLFVAQYEDDPRHQEQLLANLKKGKSGPQASLGRLCSLAEFRGFDAFMAGDRLSRLARSSGWQPRPAGEVIVACAPLRNEGSPSDRTQICYLRSMGRIQASTDWEEFSSGAATSKGKKHPRNVLELQLNPELADPRYLVHWFNDSEIGQATLASVGRGTVTRGVTASDLMDLTLYLPPLDEQLKALEGAALLQRIRAESSELEDSLWNGMGDIQDIVAQIKTINQEDRHEDWIETLPFPLASILWRHHAGGGSYRDRYEVLLHFFEATAAFLATLHLSAFMSSDDLWGLHGGKLNRKLKLQNLPLERASFGAWKLAAEYLSSECGRLLKDDDRAELWQRVYGTANHRVMGMISHGELRSLLQRANKIRNDWSGHAGAISEEKARRIHDELMELIQRLRGLFGRTWLEYELIQPGESRYKKGIHYVTASRLMGTRSAPFEKVMRESSVPLESDALYLFDAASQNGLRLQPFVRVMPSPEKQATACFIFNRRDHDRSRFISYHFEQESEIEDVFPDLDEAINRLHVFDEERL